MLQAGRANSRAKLTMSNRERQDYAWRLVKMGGYKAGQIVAASNISRRQVFTMRKVASALGEDDRSHRRASYVKIVEDRRFA